MDENYKLNYNPKDLNGIVDERGLSIRDLINTDATGLITRYSRRSAGNIALARIRLVDSQGITAVDGITSDGDWDKFLKATWKKAADDRIDPKETTALVKNLQFAYDSIKGRSVNKIEVDNPEAAFWFRALRKFNYSRVMNQAGFSSVPELGNVLASTGLKASMSQMEWFGKVINDAGELAHTSRFADDIEHNYSLRSQLQAVGMNARDRQEFLYGKSGKLTMDNIAAASFAGAGWSSIIPTLTDTFSDTGLYDPVFSNSRSSGQASSALFGIPSVSVVTDSFKAIKGGVNAAKDGMSQEEERAMLRILPFAQAMPFVEFNNTLISGVGELPHNRGHH